MADIIVSSSTYGFSFNSQIGVYLGYLGETPLVDGETYSIQWDDKLYTCKAENGTFLDMEGVGFGNKAMLGMGDDTGEPFVVSYVGGTALYAVTLSPDEAHVIYIERVDAASDAPYILKVSKEDREFSGFKKLSLERADGTVGYFTPGEPSSKKVVLDFSNGDMTITPDKDKFLTEVTIVKPATLEPENIKKDEVVAGIKGEYSAGGEGGTVQSKAINFYDPMGNIIYSYTRAEAAALTELPPGPQLEGFEFYGWTHTLDQVRTEKFFTDVGPAYAKNGQVATVLIVDIPSYSKTVTVSLSALASSSSLAGITIDWGDGSSSIVTATTSTSSTSYLYKSSTHTYDTEGIKYIAVYRTQSDSTLRYTLSSGYTTPHKPSIYNSAYVSTGVNLYTCVEDCLVSYLDPISGGKYGTPMFLGHLKLRFISVRDHGSDYIRVSNCPMLRAIASTGIYFTNYSDIQSIYNCPSLKRLGGSNRSINTSNTALEGCDSLKELVIGASTALKNINHNRNIVLTTTTVPNKSSAITYKYGTGDIYVPDEAVETYKASELFAPVVDCIKPISEYPDY